MSVNHEYLARLVGSAVDDRLGPRLDRIVELLERSAPDEPEQKTPESARASDHFGIAVDAHWMTPSEAQEIVKAAVGVARNLRGLAGRNVDDVNVDDVLEELQHSDDAGYGAAVDPGSMSRLIERLREAKMPGWWMR